MLTHIPFIHTGSANQTPALPSASAGQQEAELHYVNKEGMLQLSSPLLLHLYHLPLCFAIIPFDDSDKQENHLVRPDPVQTGTVLTCRWPREPGRALQEHVRDSGSLRPQSWWFIFHQTTCDL